MRLGLTAKRVAPLRRTTTGRAALASRLKYSTKVSSVTHGLPGAMPCGPEATATCGPLAMAAGASARAATRAVTAMVGLMPDVQPGRPWGSLAQRGAGRPVARHAVHPAARGRRGRAQVDARQRGRVRHGARDGAGVQLAQVLEAGDDVAADVVGVAALHLRAVHGRAGGDQVAEAGRKALDLRLDRRSEER